MTTETVDLYVWRVWPSETQNPRVTQFLIDGVQPEKHDSPLQLSTVNPLKASLCQRAHDQQRRIRVSFHRNAYGYELESAELVTE